MAKKSSSTNDLIGILLIVVGIGLVLWGHQISGSFYSKLTMKLTGAHADKVMRLYIGGAASFVIGLVLFLKK
ncbi:MAG: DUF3185 family protein [Desulfobacteraceae bacterium]|nr:DUF3185 family protein [Desulfobacteraceae bacterium]